MDEEGAGRRVVRESAAGGVEEGAEDMVGGRRMGLVRGERMGFRG